MCRSVASVMSFSLARNEWYSKEEANSLQRRGADHDKTKG